jgi:hypothetical protein
MILLTFDTDYLSKEDISRFIDEFAIPGFATFFLWKPFANLDIGNHEIGIHPFLDEKKPWKQTIDEFLDELGENCQSIRPHSCVYSHMLGIYLAKKGFSNISQSTYLYKNGLEAHRHPWGLWELPIYYMDSMDFTMSMNWPSLNHQEFSNHIISQSLDNEALFVYDFHPLHIILNTSSFHQYQSIRSRIVEQHDSPFDLKFSGFGVCDFYTRLVKEMTENNVKSFTCSQLVDKISDIK